MQSLPCSSVLRSRAPHRAFVFPVYTFTRGITMSTALVRKLSSFSAWRIARYYGCHYSGDCNPIPHGGFFYDARDWKEHGYANCVEFWFDYDNHAMVVSTGTINKCNDMAAAFDCCDVPLSYRDMIDVQIEACQSYAGIESDDCVNGMRSFAVDENDNIPEEKVWSYAKGLIRRLGR